MTVTPKSNKQDPLGLLHLGQIITQLREPQSSDVLAEKISLLASQYDNTLEAYSLLRDRYQLLKESNALLAEELAWLRDQCDDFAVERAELLGELGLYKKANTEEEPVP